MKCQKNPRGVINAVERIVVLGDVHGSYNSLLKILQKSEIINKNLVWIGGKTNVVLIGDILDRGGRLSNYGDEQSELKILKLLDTLRYQSNQVGGDVHIMIGNHELMNVMGDFRYVSKQGFSDFSNQRKDYFKPGNRMAIYFACNANSILKIGDWLFSHAGISNTIASKYEITTINNKVRDFLLGNISLEELQNSSLLDIFWNRDFGHNSPNCLEVESVLAKTKSKGMIVGHTVQSEGINTQCNGKLARVDTGMSEVFGKLTDKNSKHRLQALEIINNTKLRIIN